MTAQIINLEASSRTVVGKKVKNLRQKGLIPAVVYGHGLSSTPITVDAKALKKALQEAGTSSLVDLSIDGKKPIKILFHEPQLHYLHHAPIHADLYAVKMTEKIETAVPIHFIGVAPAVEELEGNFIANKDELTIRCLPADLIPSIDVDISVLKTFDDQIRVADVKLPEAIEVMDDSEEVVALVQEQRSEAELEELTADTSEAEAAAVEELGKEEAPAEGEEAGEATPPAAE